MNLTKIEVKILKYVSKHPNCTYSEIYKKYPTFKDCFSKFEFQQLIRSDDPNANLMGNEYEDLNNPTIISLAHDGIVYLESHKILTLPFVVTNLIVPIIVGIASAVISALILAA